MIELLERPSIDGLTVGFYATFTLPADYNVWQWAEANRWLGTDVTPQTGPYRTAFAPYQKEPQEAFLDPMVIAVIMNWASRLGKTEIMNNL